MLFFFFFGSDGTREEQCLARECTAGGFGSGRGGERGLLCSQLPLHSAARWNDAWQQWDGDAALSTPHQ